MLIKVNTNNVNDRDIILEKSGIAMAKRFLYLFVKVSDYHNNHNRPITTKAVLVNVSLRKSDKLDNYYRKHDGMMLTKKHLYVFGMAARRYWEYSYGSIYIKKWILVIVFLMHR